MEHRDPHVTLIGTRDGSAMMTFEVEPLLAWSDPGAETKQLYVLGVAHRRCLFAARERLRRGEVAFSTRLPAVTIEEEDLDFGSVEALDRPPTLGRCAFCGEASTSQEHVWPQWISRQFVGRGPFTVKGSLGDWSANVIPVTTDLVCPGCNNTWLSVLENDTRAVLASMIQGNDRDLSSKAQKVLSTWAYKTALMLDIAERRIVPSGFHRSFRIERCPPAASVIWVGGYLGPLAVSAYQHPLWLGADHQGPPLGMVSTFSVGRVVFQVVQHFAVGPAQFRDGRAASRALHQIWPVGQAVTWPRNGAAFGEDSLRALASSITDTAHPD